MIGLLKGTVVYKDASSLLIDVQGVGYKALVPVDVLSKSVIGDAVTVYTHTHVREDLLELYGFTQPEDLRVFEYLIGVSGVGCKTALGIFSVGTRGDILNAITTGNVAFFSSVPRLGKKNAQKIIIELKNKLGGIGDVDLSQDGQDISEVVNALKGFGFTQGEAQTALKAIKGEGETIEEKLRLALKYLGK